MLQDPLHSVSVHSASQLIGIECFGIRSGADGLGLLFHAALIAVRFHFLVDTVSDRGLKKTLSHDNIPTERKT